MLLWDDLVRALYFVLQLFEVNPSVFYQATMNIEEKWQANREKVSFVKTFPGMVSKWESLCGNTLERVVPIENKKGCLFIFSGGLFTYIPTSIPEPSNLLLALEAGRPWLETFHTEAYRTLDTLIARDRELQRKARLDKLLSAVKNNYPAIPEIKVELKKALGGA